VLFSDVQTSVSNLLNRRDTTTAQLQQFIQTAIMRIQRELRTPMQEKSVIVTIGAGFAGLPIPTDFLELIDLIPVTTPFNQIRLQKCDITRALQTAAVPGFPEVYCRQGGLWILGPSPQLNDEIQIDYYAEFTPLVNPTDTNILITVAWDLVVYGALSEACLFYTDKRRGSQLSQRADGTTRIMDGFEGKYNDILDRLNEMAETDDDSGAAAVQVPIAYITGEDLVDFDIVNWVP
jgi:hypothetical protein